MVLKEEDGRYINNFEKKGQKDETLLTEDGGRGHLRRCVGNL